jgi:hypothetical protein
MYNFAEAELANHYGYFVRDNSMLIDGKVFAREKRILDIYILPEIIFSNFCELNPQKT